jgi:hypothetical protein
MLTFLAHWFMSPWWWRRHIPLKHRFLREPHNVTSQEMAVFIITAVKPSNLNKFQWIQTCATYSHTGIVVHVDEDCSELIQVHEFVPSLKLIKHCATKACAGSGCIYPHILDLYTSCRWVVSFTFWLLHHQGKNPWFPLYRRLCEYQK